MALACLSAAVAGIGMFERCRRVGFVVEDGRLLGGSVGRSEPKGRECGDVGE